MHFSIFIFNQGSHTHARTHTHTHTHTHTFYILMFIAHAYWTEQTLIENNATSEDFSINITVILLQCLPCC